MPTRASRGEPDYHSLAYFRHLIRRFLVFSEGEARNAGLQPQQHQLLLAIKGLPPDAVPTIGALAWQLQVKHHTLVGLVDRLCSLGMIRRNRSSRDHREVLIEITPLGESVLRRLTIAHRKELKRVVPLLLPALTTLFESSLEKESTPCPTPPPPRKRRASATSRRPRGSSSSASSRSRSAPSAPTSPSPSSS